MNSALAYLVLSVMFLSNVLAQPIARVSSVKIFSKSLNQERELLIYTPVDYDNRIHELFEVVYVFDSQSREFFDYTSAIMSFVADSPKSVIVVGVTSPYNEKLDYSRNNDFLPVLETADAKKRYGKYHGNADQFLDYVASEVIPFIDANYRTLDSNTAVGHSLGASFILNALLEKPGLFQNCIAVSPNFAYDQNKLEKKVVQFDYSKITKPTFIYLSHADEGVDYWPEWKPAREKVYAFFNGQKSQKNITVKTGEFPDSNHWRTFPLGLNDALTHYFKTIQPAREKMLDAQEHEVTITVKVPKKDDVVYITGNQTSLADWNPGKIMMVKTSDHERKITVKLKGPAQFKFTRGSWDTAAEVTGTHNNCMIKPESAKTFEFEITGYVDRQDEK